MSHTYKYARPAVTADCVVFTLDDEDLKVLLIQRGQEPFKGQWALPGGFAEVGESLEDTARRELHEETGLKNVFLEQLYTFSTPGRDPREHVILVFLVVDFLMLAVKYGEASIVIPIANMSFIMAMALSVALRFEPLSSRKVAAMVVACLAIAALTVAAS